MESSTKTIRRGAREVTGGDRNEKRQSSLVYFTVSAGDSSKTNDGPLNKSAFKF